MELGIVVQLYQPTDPNVLLVNQSLARVEVVKLSDDALREEMREVGGEVEVRVQRKSLFGDTARIVVVRKEDSFVEEDSEEDMAGLDRPGNSPISDPEGLAVGQAVMERVHEVGHCWETCDGL